MWLDTEVRALSYHVTLLQGDGGRVQGIPETTAELLRPFLPLPDFSCGIWSLIPALTYQ